MICTEKEIKTALLKINKNKAIGGDHLSLKPIDKKEILTFRINGLSKKEKEGLSADKISDGEWRRHLMKYIIINTTKYINDIIQNKVRLPFGQAEIR